MLKDVTIGQLAIAAAALMAWYGTVFFLFSIGG